MNKKSNENNNNNNKNSKNNAKSKPQAKKSQAKSQTQTKGGAQQEIKTASRAKEIFVSLIPFIIGVTALLIVVFFIFTKNTGIVGAAVKTALYGLFSGAAWLIPILMVNMLIFWKADRESDNTAWKIVDSAIVILIFGAWLYYFYAIGKDSSLEFNIKEFWERGRGSFFGGGGVVGGAVGWVFYKCFAKVGTPIVLAALTVVFGVFLFGLTPVEAATKIREAIKKIREAIKERKRRRKYGKRDAVVYLNKPEPEEVGNDRTEAAHAYRTFDSGTFEDDPFAPKKKQGEGNFADVNPYTELRRPDKPMQQQSDAVIESIKAEEGAKEKDKNNQNEIDLDGIFYGKGAEANAEPEAEDDPFKEKSEDEKDEKIEVKRRKLMSEVKASDIEKDLDGALEDALSKREYRLPPVSLLTSDHTSRSADMSGEITANARKLVDTLASFKVRARVVNVSRGPTITRYELAPEEGVRVRAIASLSDDISLSLASTGVRIEAPIPGKAAVGIEVPNRERETVYLRDLIDDDRFDSSKPKLSAAIGVDVAGDPIYIDIAKMPHLLVAGTTGSGKSVCMNCLILSILYKATPDEVKMIMIDPKKVEFNVYNGLPHLIVPVVTNPKKAAGALAWAVAEMERRYERIEGAGVRDLKNYNIVTKDDPEKEYMAQLVIFIDELADLMMTSPKEVEDYICRIAQKGRACGIHLIIGTQRPSVDVITGLIKANVPSRMAFTVSSQVDSRTILDIAGAEKLVGRGDMLFAPLGSPKPLRVQGAFVSDSEVEAVTSFIMKNVGDAEYDDNVMQDIEREAENCSVKGAPKKAGGDSGEGGEEQSDPMLDAAIDLAIESGKISTSLIQRRLSLGYGRAAKLIDAMEQMGVVSAPEGQKPRNVLISAQEWAQIKMARG